MSLTQRLPFVPRALVFLMSAALVLLVGGTHAWAQSSEPLATGTLESSDIAPGDAIVPGEEVTIAGSGFAPGAQIDIFIESDPVHLGVARADATGAFEATVSIPTTGLPPGAHTLKATGPDATGGIRVLALPVEVEDTAPAGSVAAPASPSAGPSLPVTGGNAVPLSVGAAGAIAVGAVLVRRSRRATR